jgi:hypothetical protein
MRYERNSRQEVAHLILALTITFIFQSEAEEKIKTSLFQGMPPEKTSIFKS